MADFSVSYSVIFLIVLFMTSINFPAVYSNCTTHREQTPRIIAGNTTHIEDFPYQASLQYKPTLIHFCGGSIIGDHFILTAAHCTQGELSNPENMGVRLGTTFQDCGGYLYDVKKIINHPRFNVRLQNDISIIKLKNNIQWSETIQPIKLPKWGEPNPDPGAIAIISGWGSIKRFDIKTSPSHLMSAEIPIVPMIVCQLLYFLLPSPVDYRQICAGKILQGASSYKGDSGGPLVVNGVQFGIVSWGNPFFNSPTVYTSVVAFKKFIYETMHSTE